MASAAATAVIQWITGYQVAAAAEKPPPPPPSAKSVYETELVERIRRLGQDECLRVAVTQRLAVETEWPHRRIALAVAVLLKTNPLGGQHGVIALITDFVGNAATDEHDKAAFETDISAEHPRLVFDIAFMKRWRIHFIIGSSGYARVGGTGRNSHTCVV